jgi:hypothetical protein
MGKLDTKVKPPLVQAKAVGYLNNPTTNMYGPNNVPYLAPSSMPPHSRMKKMHESTHFRRGD